MPGAEVRVIQGVDQGLPPSDINIVIDVIRAFTVAHLAFVRGTREILLVNSVEEAMALKAQQPGYLLAGEIRGLPIPGFDLDNSPYRVSLAELQGRTLVQKTTHGVTATLAALDARYVLVTGFSNASSTARFARGLVEGTGFRRINVIASHGQDDDDLACAELIRDRILNIGAVDPDSVIERIRASRPAAKFLTGQPNGFEPRDLDFCVRAYDSDFVMQVDSGSAPPRIGWGRFVDHS
ncbi:MAG: 2-phosphosulfolactate phosphatase [Hylemonella sp.]|nr:2-phosphosulfolactate phosphatase [Hylemonella sp.]